LNVLGGPMLSPDKLAVIAVLSYEMLNGSNAEAMVRDALTRSAPLALDTALFDASASSAARPAGLRNGISALTASALTRSHRGDERSPPRLLRSAALPRSRWSPPRPAR
jgi:hypothetical protein